MTHMVTFIVIAAILLLLARLGCRIVDNAQKANQIIDSAQRNLRLNPQIHSCPVLWAVKQRRNQP